MLAGHWPYWRPEKIHAHPDELLRARLTYADSTKSLVEQDLVTLADGLEGRSTNPVSLLVSKCQKSLPFVVYYDVHYDAKNNYFLFSFKRTVGQFTESMCRFGNGCTIHASLQIPSGKGSESFVISH